MTDAQAAWIASYIKREDGVTLGKCRAACEDMRAEFPELKEVRGHVLCLWGKRGHVWLVDEAGEIVDPTRGQFPGSVEYEPWKPGDEVRVGRCMNCGDDIWEAVQTLDVDHGQKSVCSPECEAELRREYGL